MITLPHTAVITEPAWTTDDYGNDRVKDWDTPASEITTDAWFQPRVGQEDETGQDIQVGDGVVFLPAGTAITGEARVSVLGLTYEVVGPPKVWTAGWSAMDHTEAVLRVVS